MKRLAVGACLATLSLAASAPPAPAAVTIGSNLGRAPNVVEETQQTRSQAALPAGSAASGGLASPVNGTVTRGRIRVGSESAPFAFRVIRPVGGGLFTGAGTSATVFPGTSATFGFDLSLPIQIGDRIGINCNCSPVGDAGLWLVDAGAGSALDQWGPPLADGGPGRPPTITSALELTINADIEPTATFTLGRITRNKKKGTATLTANVPNPGELTGSGKGVKVARAVGAAPSKAVTAPGTVKLTIRAKGKKKRRLNETGKVKVKPEITYTPTGGTASIQSKKLTLKKR